MGCALQHEQIRRERSRKKDLGLSLLGIEAFLCFIRYYEHTEIRDWLNFLKSQVLQEEVR